MDITFFVKKFLYYYDLYKDQVKPLVGKHLRKNSTIPLSLSLALFYFIFLIGSIFFIPFLITYFTYCLTCYGFVDPLTLKIIYILYYIYTIALKSQNLLIMVVWLSFICILPYICFMIIAGLYNLFMGFTKLIFVIQYIKRRFIVSYYFIIFSYTLLVTIVIFLVTSPIYHMIILSLN